MSFDSFALSPEVLQAVAAAGYTSPTPIQRQALPIVLARQDLIAIAQTGTGKTAAFSLPMIQNLLTVERGHPQNPRALILTPTRELALQVYGDVLKYAANTGLTAVVIHGGVSYEPQLEKLKAGVDIVVATPGRLRDHLSQRNVQLFDLEILVLDEADRMLDMGFSAEVDYIVTKTAVKRQTLLFSATFSDEIRKLSQKYLRAPESIHATPQKVTAQNVQHLLHPVEPERKLDLLFEVVHKHLKEQILVFARTKDRVDEVAKDLLDRGLVVMATHGDRTQAHRTKALARFKENKIQILVATDIAARGLDTTDLGLVINFDLPNLAEDYVHRIGRTGRAGKSGQAVSLVTERELRLLDAIEKVIKFKIPVVKFDGFVPNSFGGTPPSHPRRFPVKPGKPGQSGRFSKSGKAGKSTKPGKSAKPGDKARTARYVKTKSEPTLVTGPGFRQRARPNSSKPQPKAKMSKRRR